MLEEIKKIKSGKKDLRDFGATFAAVFGIVALLLWWKDKTTYKAFLGLAVLFLATGFALPNILKPLQRAWMAFSILLGAVMTRLILSALYFIVFTPLSLAARITGKKFLDLEFKKNNSPASYWIPKKKIPFDKTRYERQF